MFRARTAAVSGFVLLLGACSSSQNGSGDSTGNGYSSGGVRSGTNNGATANSANGASSNGASSNGTTGATGSGTSGSNGSSTGGSSGNSTCAVGNTCTTPNSYCVTGGAMQCQCVNGVWGLCQSLTGTGGVTSTGSSGGVPTSSTGGTTSTGATGTGATSSSTGGTGVCTPTACAANNCGAMDDGCGKILDCGTCSGTCGAVAPNVCTPVCVPKDCTTLGYNCGTASDGCGHGLDCGTCTGPGEVCGANSNLFQCGVPGGGPTGCINFCPQQVPNCTGGATTTLKGTVYAPNGSLPLPNAIVYVPNGSTTSPYGVGVFIDGVANGNGCQCNVTGNPLVQTVSGVDGSFILTNVPAGTNIPLVIQLGRWRRLITIPAVSQCQTTTLTATQTRLPTRQAEGSPVDAIPLMALSTGQVDGLECVLRKMGVEDSQFAVPGRGGRIEMYVDNGAVMNGIPNYSQLTSSQAMIDQYDALIFPCRGNAHDEPAARKAMVLDAPSNTNSYTNKGGRAFFTHFSYAWLYSNAPSNALPWLSTTNTRNVDGYHWGDPPNGVNIQVQVQTNFARGLTFSQWLGLAAVGGISGTNPPQITVLEARENMHTPVTLPIATAQEWLTTYNTAPNPMAALHVTFDTPWAYPADQQCGRVLWSGFHVTTSAVTNGSTNGLTFPTECNSTFSAQEKVLAYMLFDMTSCITPPPPCVPVTCAQQGITCGPAGDGCGGTLDCGPCPPNQCVPKTCPSNDQCAIIPDGCGNVLYCGAC
jgi:hypothetical protein